jgi:hypothetical protein
MDAREEPMTDKRLVLAIDQGTTGSAALLVDRELRVLAHAKREFPQRYPQPGWVEHDPEEIWQSVLAAVREVFERSGRSAREVAAIGITNQRETTVLWERDGGRPVHPAIVWQCRRTAEICAQLRQEGLEREFRDRTGLVLDPYFSGTKVRWLLEHRRQGALCVFEQVEMVFGGRDQLFDLTAYPRHVGQDTTGNLLSKAVLQHGARAYIKGLISIERTARGTDSFLGEFGMLLDKQSRSVTIPSLEIDQPDCRRAAHASSVGPIDPAQLFYLESRGITPDEARKFITLGFLEPVVARVPLEAEQERLWAMLSHLMAFADF